MVVTQMIKHKHINIKDIQWSYIYYYFYFFFSITMPGFHTLPLVVPLFLSVTVYTMSQQHAPPTVMHSLTLSAVEGAYNCCPLFLASQQSFTFSGCCIRSPYRSEPAFASDSERERRERNRWDRASKDCKRWEEGAVGRGAEEMMRKLKCSLLFVLPQLGSRVCAHS